LLEKYGFELTTWKINDLARLQVLSPCSKTRVETLIVFCVDNDM